VASSPDILAADVGDKWDSGRVASSNSVQVSYAGSSLNSGERSYWKVRVWDRNGKVGKYSDSSTFELGLLRQTDWGGQWIAAQKGISSPLLRREFSISTAIKRARLYISGLGCYQAFINGVRVGDRELDPASTYYNNDQHFRLGSRVLYSTYDVTGSLKEGRNALGVTLGHGWFSMDSSNYAVQPNQPVLRTPYGDRPQLIAQLNIEFADGRTQKVVSDLSWKVSPSPITYNDLFNGETYDARLEQKNWDMPGFDDSSWEVASPATAPSGALVAEQMPPETVAATLPVARIIAPKNPDALGTYIYDFGQHFSGWVRLVVSGPRGAKLVLRYGSRLYTEDDSLDTRSNEPHGAAGALQQDIYILKGDGPEIWEPKFTLHGFRYVEVAGFRDAPSVKGIEGRVVRSALEQTGTFVSSNALLNRIHQNIQWTFLSSLQGIWQDAADRSERIAWLGDPLFVAEDHIMNYEMAGFLEKWLDDIRDNQKEDGNIPIVSPLHYFRNDNEGYPVWPCWESTYPFLIWYLYEYYGDRQVVESHYHNVKRLVNFMGGFSKNYIITAGLGDHMEPQESGFSSFESRHTPDALTSTAYYYADVMMVTRMAKLLGRFDDAKTFEILAQDIRKAFNREFFDVKNARYADGSITSNALPLYLGLVPPKIISAVAERLVHEIAAIHENHIYAGIIGMNAAVHALMDTEQDSLLFTAATQSTYPSLGDQIRRGSTTVCETLECGPWASQNMKMFGSIDKFLFQSLAGIQRTDIAYGRIMIRPRVVGDLQMVSATQRTIRGLITVKWTKRRDSFDLDVLIPTGVDADILIPTFDWADINITEGGAPVWQSGRDVSNVQGLTSASKFNKSVIIRAGGGKYAFSVSGKPH